MFKYLLFVVIGLVCLIILFSQCRGIGERFRERMDEFQNRRQERMHDRREWKEHRWDRQPPPIDEEQGEDDGRRRHIFNRFGRFRRDNTSDE